MSLSFLIFAQRSMFVYEPYSSRSFNNYSHNFMFNRLLKVLCALVKYKIYDHKWNEKKTFHLHVCNENWKIPTCKIKVWSVNSARKFIITDCEIVVSAVPHIRISKFIHEEVQRTGKLRAMCMACSSNLHHCNGLRLARQISV